MRVKILILFTLLVLSAAAINRLISLTKNISEINGQILSYEKIISIKEHNYLNAGELSAQTEMHYNQVINYNKIIIPYSSLTKTIDEFSGYAALCGISENLCRILSAETLYRSDTGYELIRVDMLYNGTSTAEESLFFLNEIENNRLIYNFNLNAWEIGNESVNLRFSVYCYNHANE